MNTKLKLSFVSITASALLLAPSAFLLAQAAVGGTLNANATLQTTDVGSGVKAGVGAKADIQVNLLARAKDRADQEIDRRVRGMNQLLARVQEMKRVSANFKTSLTATVQAEITNLTNLKT